MPTVPLPADPSLGHLRKLAKDLRRAVLAGAPEALAEVAEHHPDGAAVLAGATGFPLNAAQLVVARRHGFASWPRLVERLRSLALDRGEVLRLASEFLRLACRTDGDGDDVDRQWERARSLLAAHPGIGDSGIHVAAATADAQRVGRLLAAEPESAGAPGGPFGWPPLLYLVCARHDPGIGAQQMVDTARLLLRAGADPGVSRPRDGGSDALTVLSGLLGGSGDTVHPLRHPHTHNLAGLFLGRGRRGGGSSHIWYVPQDWYHARRNWAREADFERCRRAATSDHPDPDLWRPLLTASSAGVTAIAFRTPEGPVFCELTPTTVTVSPPAAVRPPAGTALLAFHTRSGTLAGVVPPEVRSVTLERPTDTKARKPAVVANGVFLLPHAFAVTEAGLVLRTDNSRTSDIVPVDALPRQAAGIIDRPRPAPDRRSPAGLRLSAVLAEADCPPAVDPDQWTPGAYAELTATQRLQLGRYGSLLATCWLGEPRDRELTVVDLDPGEPSDQSIIGTTIAAHRSGYYDFRDGRSDTVALVGVLYDERVASITLAHDGRPGIAAAVTDGTFVLTGLKTPGGPGTPNIRLVVRDREGNLLEEIPVERGSI